MSETERDSLTEKEDGSVTLTDIRALVAERQRFDDWLTALESKRAETPVRVFERVHADYVARRDAVVDGLHAHVGSLESLEQNLSERLQSLEAQLAEREDARAEGMLRMAVGEFDADKWETTRQEVEATIAQLGTDREALITEADDVRSLLASARHRPGVQPVPEQEPLVVPSAPDVSEELVSTNVAEAIAHVDPAAVEHTIDLDDEGDLTPAHESTHASSLVQDDVLRTDPYLRAVRQQQEAARDIESAFAMADDPFVPVPEADANKDSAADMLPHFSSGDVASTSDVQASQQSDADRDREANAAVDALDFGSANESSETLDDIDVFGEPASASRNESTEATSSQNEVDPYAPSAQGSSSSAPPSTPRVVHPFPGSGSTPSTPSASANSNVFDEFAFLRSVTESGNNPMPNPGAPSASAPADQAKTLRCTECGTMNFPTEWYCERCGGELAAF